MPGSLLQRFPRGFLRLSDVFALLRLGSWRTLRLLRRLAVLRELFQFRLELGAARGDLLEQFVGCVFAQAREFFDELNVLAEKELKRSGEFVLPGMVKLVVQKRKARMGRNPATGEAIKIPAKTVVKARIAKQLKDAVLPRK